MARQITKRAKADVPAQMIPIRRLWLTTREAMSYLNCSRDFLDAQRIDSSIRCSKVGHSLYWNLQDINDMLDANCENAAGHRVWKAAHRVERSL